MKKHLVGFAIFSLVIASNIIVNKLFHKPAKLINIFEVSHNYAGKLQPQSFVELENLGVKVNIN